ncbi:hypothetical protein HYS50_03885 [Candidatus Woesearchaeota archaeon]|nr:hypothetical protein [Candidatus Woesearchaeota archaeon]
MDEFIPLDYGERLREQLRIDLEHFLNEGRLGRVLNDLLHERVFRFPLGTMVVAVERDSPYVQFFKVPERFTREALEKILFIRRMDVPDYVAHLDRLTRSTFDPMDLYQWEHFSRERASPVSVSFYACQIPALCRGLEQARIYHGPMPYLALPITV